MSATLRPGRIVIKRYGGGRLYDPAGSRYVSRDQIRRWAQAGTEVAVIDAETGADVTAISLGRPE